MPRYPRFFQFASVAVLFSLLHGRSVQAPPEPVTRFRAVEGYSVFITFKSDDDMQVTRPGNSMRWTHKEQFVARIDLTERHLDNDYVEWRGEEFAEQILEQTRRETHFSGGSVYEVKSAGQGRSKTKVHLYIDELKRTSHVSVDTG
ncbi:MAG: hypothetical protein SGI92_32495 [Bryobacteraceae bacterium]|nr:hypothetical protein [Bryobacteraceae bacterium]